jgi:transposase InsO family protein
MSETNIRKVLILDGKNYLSWKTRMLLKLKTKGLSDAVEKDDYKEFSKDLQAQELILDHIDTNLDNIICNETTAYSMWSKLDKHFNRITMASAMEVYAKFAAVKLEPSELIENLAIRINTNYQRLIEMKYTIEDLKILALLHALPPTYEATITTIIQKDKKDWDFNQIKDILIEVQDRLKIYENHNDSESAMKIKDKRWCKYCKRTNHNTEFCWSDPTSKHYRGNHYNKTNNYNNNSNFIENNNDENYYQFSLITSDNCLSTNSNYLDKTWFIDSGASKHYTKHKEFLAKYEDVNPFSINVANGNQIDVVGKGDVILKVNNNGDIRSVLITDVYYVPNMKFNLLSVRQLEKNNARITFENNYCNISKNNQNVLTVCAKYNNYIIEDLNNYDYETANIVKNESLYYWHSILGHTNINTLNNIIKQGIIHNINSNDQNTVINCKTCIRGKQHRNEINSSMVKSSGLLQIVHSDVCGPMKEPTPEGFRYFVSVIDDYSRMSYVALIKNKSDVPQTIADFINMAQTQLKLKVKEFHSDNGTEYVNEKLNSILKQNGTIHTKSAPNTPQQNSIAERFNRTILEMATCMIQHNKVPEKFWGYAILYANKIKNRIPSQSINNKIPYFIWYNKNPNLKHYNIFGSNVFNLIEKSERTSKFGSHSNNCLYLGTDSDHGIYILYNYNTKRIIRSRNVKFLNENNENNSTNSNSENNNEIYEIIENSNYNNNDNIIKNHNNHINEINDSSNNNSNNTENNITQSKSTTNNPQTQSEDISDELNYSPNLPTYKLNQRIQKLREWEKRIKSPKTLNNNNNNENANITENSSEFALSSIQGPGSYKTAMNHPDKNEWQKAIDDELDSIKKNGVWSIINKPNNKNIISTRWVFVKKMNENGELQKYKARLVARGFEQIHGIDYNETFAPVVRLNSIRIIFSIAVQFNMQIHQMDVKTAFLNGYLDEDIYIEIPDGINANKQTQCCKLHKSLYGLKQSPLSWNIVLDKFLTGLNLKRTSSDYGVYYDDSNPINLIITTYVDDLLIASNDINKIIWFKKQMTQNFEMSDLGLLKYILGIQVDQDGKSIKIHQKSYIHELLTKFQLNDSKTYNTPMEFGIKLNKNQDIDQMTDKPYSSLIGSLLYLSNSTHPDITFAVHRLSSYNSNPNEIHWKAAKRILKYLKKTDDLGLVFKNSNDCTLHGYSDSDWASDLDTRRSTTGYFVTLNRNPISWCSKRQNTIALSTAEAEYMGISETIKELIWIKKLLTDLKITDFKTELACDNQSAIQISKNPVFHQRTKHIDIRYHFIREKIQEMKIKLYYLPTELMIADLLTKPLPYPRFIELCKPLFNDIKLRGEC